jgi:hypothetical protein
MVEGRLARDQGMKLYDSPFAPNPRRVRIFLAEKGIEIPKVFIDLAQSKHKEPAYEAVNPLRRIPGPGTRRRDDTHRVDRHLPLPGGASPRSAAVGTDPLSRALIAMWQRRLEFGLLGTVGAAFRHPIRP